VHSYNKDAAMTYHHAGAQPVCAPNSHGGPQADPQAGADLGWSVAAGELGRYAYDKHAEDDDFGQPRTLYRDVMNDTDRAHLVTNIVGHASDDVSNETQLRVIAYWTNIDAQLGAQIAAGLGHGNGGANGHPTAEAVADRANRA
jgi:catalase